MSPPRRFAARLAAGAAGVLALLAATPPAAAQIARIEKAHLELAADRSSYAPGTRARLVAVARIDEGWHAQAHVPTYDYLIPTELTLVAPAGWTVGPVAYPPPAKYRFAFAQDPLDVYAGTVAMIVEVALPAGAGSGRIEATLRYQACDDKECLPPVETTAGVDLAVGAAGVAQHADLFALAAPAPAATPAAPPAPGARRSWLAMLGLAWLGGLILNAMPCVLPILSLKVFGLVKAAGRGRREVATAALATSAGILLSFWGLAGAAIGARRAGAAVGWGIQFQEPGFVAFLAVVVLLFALNLWGLFEIRLPGALASAADGAAAREGLGGHFASGLFATLMATPCSAPFLGTALSFALGQSAGVILAIFTAVGLGLATPYLALAVAPAAARILPRPGAWMETLRGLMGFLLAGAIVWLLFILAAQIAPEAVAVLEVTLLAIALAVWLAHRAGARGARLVWASVAAALALATVALAARAPRAVSPLAAPGGGESLAWRAFDRAEAERLAAGGRLVLLDITADWCVTCKVNERLILGAPRVREALRRHDVVLMKGDWTNRDDEIARFLAAHGRYGIPFYMLYRPRREPYVFSELLSQDAVVSALEEAARP
ncbi:MAG: thioredoxin family protein [Thermoanaerobaculia bacterium]